MSVESYRYNFKVSMIMFLSLIQLFRERHWFKWKVGFNYDLIMMEEERSKEVRP